MNTLAITFLLINSLAHSDCRNAWKYFLENRKVQNCTFIVLNASAEVVWAEYTFYFREKISNASETVKDFNVGLFENFDFDCKLSDGLSGYTIEIFELLKYLGFRFNYQKFNYTKIKNNVTNLLLSKEIDILACHPNANTNFPKEIIQLYPTLRNDYVIIYDPYKLHFTKDIFILTFAGTLWICFLVLLVILAVCLHLSIKRYSILDVNYKSWTWVDITLWANAAACQQGLSHTPNGFASRLIFFLGYVISYLLYTGFAAGITSLLLQQVTTKDITASDVEKMKVKIVLLKHFEHLGDATQNNNTLVVSTIDNVFTNINHDHVVGVLPKLLVEQHYAKNPDSHQKYVTSKLTTSQYSNSFLMQRNGSYRIVNSKLMRFRETGLLDKALRDSLLPVPSNQVVSKHSSAGIEHVGSAIAILVVGTVISTIFLVLELIFALYNGKL